MYILASLKGNVKCFSRKSTIENPQSVLWQKLTIGFKRASSIILLFMVKLLYCPHLNKPYTERMTIMITTHVIPCLNLKQIAESGQCFRMTPLAAKVLPEDADWGYRIISRKKGLTAWQKGPEICFECPKEDVDFWLTYFDADMDYQAVIDSVAPGDSYLLAAAAAGQGIRILRQDPWEMMVTFIISQQKTIPKIRELVEALCSSYGSALKDSSGSQEGETVNAFPSPNELAAATVEELLDLKLGYRAKYIHRLCQDAMSGYLDLNLLEEMEYESAMEYLTSFYGIGKKVANCVCLFGLHQIGAFPVDTWIEKILMNQYYDKRKYRRTPKNSLYDKIVKDAFGQYRGCAGIMQQYIFYFERLRSSKLS